MSPSVRAVVLDADGTLWDTRTAMEAAGAAGVTAVWPGMPRGPVADAAVRFRSDPRGAFRRFVAGELTFARMREERLRDVAAAFGLVWSSGVVAEFEAAYATVFEQTLARFEDVLPLLGWCSDQSLPVRVLTNSAQDYTEAKIGVTGLEALAGLVCSRDCVGVGKPDARAFHHVCERMGLRPREVLYVGDEWTSDAAGAADAGLRSAWLVRDDGEPAGEVVPTPARRREAAARGIPIIGSLGELPALVGGGGDLGERAGTE